MSRLWIVGIVLWGCKGSPIIDNDGDGWFGTVDCNDSNASINPGMGEIPGDGIDNDCNESTRDDDVDGDGYVPPRDCEPENPFVPSSFETAYDGLDNDCDPSTPDDDLDGDGFLLADDCDDRDPLVSPGALEIPYDGTDNDCDPTTADDDLDGDGYTGTEDCDDTDPDWSLPRVWYQDCDGDGYARSPQYFGPDPVVACVPPAADCEANEPALWTLLEPVGAPDDEANATVDCNDHDERVHPGQTSYFSDPGGPLLYPYDFDCNGSNDTDAGLFSCIPIPSGSTCYTTSVGYDAIPACGEVHTYATTCTYVNVSTCEMGNPQDRIVSCR
ncbi:MAG: putative metal-binding motif-containing protein [Myxococcales bacterium]|nr:putative metal-binding motif-containing protein [Myxococcales bacterium]MCB9670673.1 putative metal-binding motif-containing protein [Alphaproteobacteria bacterium]MCB9693765.1 putative metal-binding motif-containing protein [Alphaproteobacteria bacterium]